MEKLNLPPFTIGQVVVCVQQSNNKSLVIGRKYVVTGMRNDCSCGWIINVDRRENVALNGTPLRAGEYFICVGCGEVTKSNGFVHYHRRRFAPLKEAAAPLLTFEKIKENEKEEVLILN